MQYLSGLSGVWDSLTGQSNAKRKRLGDDAGELPDRMTTLKLFSGQLCSGRLPSSTAHPQPPSEYSSLNGNSSAASETAFQAGCTTGDWHGLARCYSWNQNPQSKVPSGPPPPPASRQQPHQNHAGSSFTLHPGSSAPLHPSSTAYSQHTYNHSEYSNSTRHLSSAHRSHIQAQPHHAFHPGVHRSAAKQHSRSALRQASAQTACHKPALPLQHPQPSADLHCSEVLSPMADHTSPNMSSSASIHSMDPELCMPSADLAESVADSPDDHEALEDVATSPNSPSPGVLTAFLALCQSPQVITALSKLQATHQLPCPTTLSVLPLDVQNCPVSMSRELSTAGSLVQDWSKASQLEWTLAGMFALCLRANLDVLDLDCIMLLSLLWILESCSSQYNSCLTVVTSNYLAYATAAAAAAGPASPPEVRNWQQDMKTSQLEVLERCRWRVHLDLQADLVPVLQQLQQVNVVSQLQTVLRQTDAESRHRRAMDAQLEAHRRYHASQAQQAQCAQHLQMQQAHSLACCESSTKPAKPRANLRLDHPSHHNARLRHEAEELHQHSLNGRYWQSHDDQNACNQHDTLISMGQRARNRAVRTKLSFFASGNVP